MIPPRDKKPLKQLDGKNPYQATDPHAVQAWLKATEDVVRLKVRHASAPAPATSLTVSQEHQPQGVIVDLHGYSRDQAYRALVRFMHYAADKKLSTIRVVTGKGRGILQQDVPLWLESMPQVAHHAQAPQAQGGAGALIVTLQWS